MPARPRPGTKRTRPRHVVLGIGVAAALVTSVVTAFVAATPARAVPAPGAGPVHTDTSARAAVAGTDLPGVRVPSLDWEPCGDGLECATAEVPLDYDRPQGRTVRLAVMRHPVADPSTRIGSLFVNPGGPGGSGLDFFRTAPPGALDIFSGFDLVTWDPRGIGESRPLVDCTSAAQDAVNEPITWMRPQTEDRAQLVEEADRFVRGCLRRNPVVLPHLSTANTARDLDLLRAAVGDRRLSYIGLSHGTHIGATYSSLFPDRVRAMVADSPVDPDGWVNHTRSTIRELASANQRGVLRFLAACGAAGDACAFGGPDPQSRYEDLVDAANQAPVPAPASASGTPVSGDDLLLLTTVEVLAKSVWPRLATALAEAEAGDASLARDLLDGELGTSAGEDVPVGAFFTTTAQDWDVPERVRTYLREGRHLYGLLPHQWWQGLEYTDVARARYPVDGDDEFRGPWTQPAAAAPALVIGITHDARTPYRWAERYVDQLGNAGLLTYRADRHGALTDLSGCVIGHVIQYVRELELPEPGATCTQPYEAFPSAAQRPRAGSAWTLDEPGLLPR